MPFFAILKTYYIFSFCTVSMCMFSFLTVPYLRKGNNCRYREIVIQRDIHGPYQSSIFHPPHIPPCFEPVGLTHKIIKRKNGKQKQSLIIWLIFFLFLQTKPNFCGLFVWSQLGFSATPVSIFVTFVKSFPRKYVYFNIRDSILHNFTVLLVY